MAISETIEVSVAGLGSVDALAASLDKAAEAAAKLDESLAGIKAGGTGGAGGISKIGTQVNAAVSKIDAAAGKMDAAVSKMEASFARLDELGKGAAGSLGDVGKIAAENAAGLADTAKAANDAAEGYARLGKAAAESGAAMDGQAVAGRRAAKSSAEEAAASEGFFSKHKELILGTGLALGYAVDKAMKFQSEMTLLHTQAGVAQSGVDKLSTGVLKLAGTTGQSPGNLAESIYHVASNMASMPGTTYAQMLKVTEMAARGASVGHANLVDTTNALTSVVASGIKGSKDYSQAMGMLNATVGSGDMSMQQLAESMASGLVPVVKGYGLTLKDVGAGLATFGDLNIRGAHAGTYLKMAVQALAVPMKTGPLKEFGLTMSTLSNDMQKGGLLKALDDLNSRFHRAGLTAQTEGPAITALFGKKAGAGLAVLMEQIDRFHSKFPLLTQSANNFGDAWKKTLDTPQQKLKNLEAGAQALAITAGNVLLPYANKALGGLDAGMQWLQGHALASKGLALGAGALVVGGITKGLFSGVESALSGVGKIGSALKIPGLNKLGQVGQAAGADAATSGLTAVGGAADAAAASLGRLAGTGGAAAAGEAETAAAGKLGGAGGLLGKGGSALGTGLMTAGGAWALGHLIGAFLPKTTSAAQQEYNQQVPGWVQAPAGFIFGNKAASLYHVMDALPRIGGPVKGQNWENWYHDIFGGGAPKITPHPAEPTLRYGNGRVFYGEVPRGLPGSENFRADIPAGLAPATAAYADGRPFYGEVPHATARPAANYPSGQPFYGEVPRGVAQPAVAATPAAPGKLAALSQTVNVKPVKIPAPDTSAVAGAMAKIKALTSQEASPKPIKIPAPDVSAVDSAKGKVTSALASIGSISVKAPKVPAPDVSAIAAGAAKAASAAAGITSAAQAAMKPAKAPAPNLSAFQAAEGAAAGDGAAIGAGLAAGIRGEMGAVTAAAAALAAAASSAMRGALAIASPSRVTHYYGTEFGAGFSHGIRHSHAKARAAAKGLSATAVLSMVQGLQGGKSAIDAALQAVTGKGSRPQDITSIDTAAAKLIAQVPAGDSGLVKMLRADNKKLDSMARQRAKLEQEITSSQTAAQNMISGASVTSALNAPVPGSIAPESSYAIVQGMGFQSANLAAFAKQLTGLQKAGLNATELSQIAQAGPDQGLGLAQGIASGGKAAITQLNSIQAKIHTSAIQIGDITGTAMYQAGQDTAKGLASGLKSELGSLDKAMAVLAKSMVASVQKHTATAKKAASRAAGGTASSAAGTSASASGTAGAAAATDRGLEAAAAALSGAAGRLSGAAGALTAAASAFSRAAGTGKGGPGGIAGHGVTHYPAAHGGGGGTVIHNHYHITQNIQGSVQTEKTIANNMRRVLLSQSSKNPGTGLQIAGRGT